MESQYNSKRIVKNTILLYFRMIVVTVVSFFTVRITLRVLGVEDYGIYNVIGGVVAFLNTISATMSSASQRYLAFDIGKRDANSFRNTFSLLVLVFLALSIIIIFASEAVGPWLITTYLKIPAERLTAAQWVFQFSLLSFCFTLLSIPYQASIIAYERMGVFAFVGLFDALGKLAFTCLLYYVDFDKLIFYSFLMLFITIANFLIQLFFCKYKLEGCVYKYYWSKKYLKEIIGYTGWSLFGAASGTLNTAGLSIVLNMFFGPLVNAAKGIADRINSLVISFSVNFYQAISPQIVKTYAAGEKERSISLVYSSSKLSFFLLLIISVPIIYGMPTLLNVWLGSDTVSDDMIIFSQLILVYSLVSVLEQPITMLIRATGNVKKYQIVVGGITLCTIPICILLFFLGLPAYWSLLSLTAVYLVAHFARLFIARSQVELSIKNYLITVGVPVLVVTVVSVGLTSLILFFFKMNDLMIILLSFSISFTAIWFLGLKPKERQFLIEKKSINRHSNYD